MGKNRLEAFSDGVIAILITIMVLELKSRMALTSRTCPTVARIPQLRLQLHLHRHLVEQAPV
jgi:uncharacterized membrane protein